MAAEYNPLLFKSLSGEIITIDFTTNVQQIQSQIAEHITTSSEHFLPQHIIIFPLDQDQDIDFSRPPIIQPDISYSFIVQKNDTFSAYTEFLMNAIDEDGVKYEKYTVQLWDFKMWEEDGENTLLQSFSIYWDRRYNLFIHQDFFTILEPSHQTRRGLSTEKIRANRPIGLNEADENGTINPFSLNGVLNKYLNVPWCQKDSLIEQTETQFWGVVDAEEYQQQEDDDDYWNRQYYNAQVRAAHGQFDPSEEF